MSWILVTEAAGHKYYAQKWGEGWKLNGLIDNAEVFSSEGKARDTAFLANCYIPGHQFNVVEIKDKP